MIQDGNHLFYYYSLGGLELRMWTRLLTNYRDESQHVTSALTGGQHHFQKYLNVKSSETLFFHKIPLLK